MSGVAFTSVSEMTPRLPNDEPRMCSVDRDRVAADDGEDQRRDDERDDEGAERQRPARASAAPRAAARARSVQGRPCAPGRGGVPRSRAGLRVGRLGRAVAARAAGHQQADLGRCRRRAASTIPTIRPSYRPRRGPRASGPRRGPREIRRIAAPAARRSRSSRWTASIAPDVEAARRLDRDHQARLATRSRARGSGAGGCRPRAGAPAVSIDGAEIS